MPLGTHQTWIGLLYTHGIVGFSAFTVAFLWSFLTILLKAKESETARVGLTLFVCITLASFVDNIDFLAYSIWPALLIIGIALNEKVYTIEAKSQFFTEDSSLPANSNS
jgi:hypothetical protein